MDLAQFKQLQRTIWSGGDYPTVGRMLEPAATTLVKSAGIGHGDRVLDVGTGSGSVAIAAARAGANVHGVDITDACFDEARRRADEAGVSVRLEIGDAEALPVEDGAYDAVLSSFAAIFAPRHNVMAAEVTRACAPGGTIGFTAWLPGGGANVRPFAALRDRLPEPPDFVMPSISWGEEDYVRKTFAPHGVEFTFQRPSMTVTFESERAFEDFMLTNSGPMMAARDALRETGRWAEARDAMRAGIAESNEADDGSYRATWPYLLAIGTKPQA